MAGCANPGGCDRSVANGGPGCRLCDVVAALPQPQGRAVVAEQAGNYTEPQKKPPGGHKPAALPAKRRDRLDWQLP